MNLKYVLNPYACAKYILSCITKGQKGISKLLEAACQEAMDGNLDIRKQVCHIGNKLLNAVEISAQDAVYLTLHVSLRQLSRSVIFIDTSVREDRALEKLVSYPIT